MASAKRSTTYSNLTFERAILDSLPANIAVIDGNGEIVCVNRAWEEFARANQMHDRSMGLGANYLDVCRAATVDPNARVALRGILNVMAGRQALFYHVYPCHSPEELRWFAMRAAPLIDYPDFVVISHENVSDQFAND